MKIKLLALVPWMAMAAADAQSLPKASVVYTHHGAFNQGFERDGDECLADMKSVQRWGWQVRFTGTDADIIAENRRVRVPSRTASDGTLRIPLGAAISQLGGTTQWDANTYTITANVRNLEIRKDTIRFDSTMAVSPKIFRLNNPDRIVLDFRGASLPKPNDLKPNAFVRMGQYNDSTFRIVIEKSGVDKVDIPLFGAGRSFELRLPGFNLDEPAPEIEKPSTPNSVKVHDHQEGHTDEASPGEAPKNPKMKVGGTPDFTEIGQANPPLNPSPTAAPVIVRAPRVQAQLNGDIWVVFPISKKLTNNPSGSFDGPYGVQFSIPNSKIESPVSLTPNNPVVKAVTATTLSNGVTQVQVRNSIPLGFRLSTTGSEVILVLVRPKASDGRISGKTIVVDAGHGGSDSGCVSRNKKFKEKDLALSISRYVAQELTEEGCAVIMTRDEDVKIALAERANIANRSRADIFVSIHINDNELVNSRSGVSIYHHGFSNMGRLLAECIQDEVDKVSGLPSMGVRKDTIRFKSGFAVLRLPKMPAALCELGFINHTKDLSVITTEAFQRRVAKAIVKGIKVFLGDAKSTEEK